MTGECGIRFVNLGSNNEIVPLSSPRFPSNYPNDLLCEWTVTATGSRSRITIRIIDFDLEDGYDFLTMGNGAVSSDADATVIVALTGLAKARTVTSEGQNMWINMATDRTGVAMGFLIDIRQIDEVQGICIKWSYSVISYIILSD